MDPGFHRGDDKAWIPAGACPRLRSGAGTTETSGFLALHDGQVPAREQIVHFRYEPRLVPKLERGETIGTPDGGYALSAHLSIVGSSRYLDYTEVRRR